MKTPTRRLRRRVAAGLLRGPLLARWVARRGRQWEQAYCAELRRSWSAPAFHDSPPRALAAASALRRILLVADCMWERNDLVPELARIAETRLLDMHPALQREVGDQTPPDAVAGAVRAFAEAQRSWSPDVILFYARPLLLSDEVFDELRRRWSCPLLGMNLDDKQQFFPYGILAERNDNYQRWAAKFDLNLTNCLPATDWYRQRGLPVLYSPQGVHRPAGLAEPESADFQYELSFLGSKKPERSVVIEQLTRAGAPIQLFGAGWPKSQWVDDPNRVFRATQINLGIGFASPSLTLTTVKGRDFECPGVGACYLTTYNWELPLHYELGREMLCYRSVEELIEIYTYYRRRPAECLKLAQAAWRRCSAEHTWEQRFRRVFRHVGFKA